VIDAEAADTAFVIDISVAFIAVPIKLIVEAVVVPIFMVFATPPCVAILTVPPKNPLFAILTAVVVLPPPTSQLEPKILVDDACPPILINLVPVPVAILTVPVLDASSYKDTAVPTALPVCVSVITEVRVDAPAFKVPTVDIDPAPKAFVMVAVLAPKAPVMVADASVDAPAFKVPAVDIDPAPKAFVIVALSAPKAPVMVADASVDAPAPKVPTVVVFVKVFVPVQVLFVPKIDPPITALSTYSLFARELLVVGTVEQSPSPVIVKFPLMVSLP
jgi:hypothetical protein